VGRIDCIKRKGWLACRRWWDVLSNGAGVQAAVFVDPRSLACELVVFTDREVWRRLPVLHPVQWRLTPHEEETCVASYVRRLVENEAQRRQVQGPEAEAWVRAHPALWEYLTLEAFDDGTKRQTATVCLFVEDGFVKIALQDRQEGRSLWVSSPSPEGGFDALEAHLAQGTGEWRRSRNGHPSHSGKGQRRPG